MIVKKPAAPVKIYQNILSAALIACIGFVLLNVTFVLYSLYANLLMSLIPQYLYQRPWWIPIARHVIFLFLIGLLTWRIMVSRLGNIHKAIFLVIPTAAVLVTIGMYLSSWPLAVYILSGAAVFGVLHYLYRTRQPWLYYYSIILVSIALLIFTLAGGDI